MQQARTPVISIVEENCINCHKCISICPVKYCIDGSGDTVSINHDLCIGCGHCIEACDHNARSWLDDFPSFMEALEKGEKLVAIAAPAIAASLPDTWSNLLGYLKSLGIAAFFDVSLGAELTVKSYLNYIKKSLPQCVIAQPCPSIVSYVEMYQPELIPYLAPADSPMVHTLKMISKSWPEYKDYKTLVISPCLAKKREFIDTGYGDYNVTLRSLEEWIDKKKIDLRKFKPADFTGPSAERAVRFSTPGGLMLTADRDEPGIAFKTKKIEGQGIYPYLRDLPAAIKGKYAPLLIDCLNCENGCNGGPGTRHQKTSHDLLASRVEKRFIPADRKEKTAGKKVGKSISVLWNPEEFKRHYQDLSARLLIRHPNTKQLNRIYSDMKKTCEADFLQCAACGYGSCEGMAIAIFNGLNKAENCHHYRQKIILEEKETVTDLYGRLHEKINSCKHLITNMTQSVQEVNSSVTLQTASLQESSAAIEEMVRSLGNLSRISKTRQEALENLDSSVRTGEKDLNYTVSSIGEITKSISGIGNLILLISEVADKTSLLSMNAAIEAAHAGDSGKGFSVVASEIKKLAETTENNVKDVSSLIGEIQYKVQETSDISGKTGKNIGLVLQEMQNISQALQEFLVHTDQMAAGNKQVNSALSELKENSGHVLNASDSMNESIGILERNLQEILRISDANMAQIQNLSGSL